MTDWKTEEPFEIVPGSGRLEFDFTGSSQHPISINPEEFRGLKAPEIAAGLLKMMRELAPGVDFFSFDMELAAGAVVEANGG